MLEVTDLVTHFRTPRGVVRAVDGVSLSLQRGEAVGIVGESGSGKTVLTRSIMGLIAGGGIERSGSIRFEGVELIDRTDKQLREIWGRSMSMVFQDPMGSLNPLMRIGEQIAEPLRVHLGMDRSSAGRRRNGCSSTSGSRSRPGGSGNTRTSSRAGCASA